MLDLAAILADVAEDERAAEGATPGEWAQGVAHWGHIVSADREIVASTGATDAARSVARHIAHNSPDRVRARCARDRALVAEVERLRAMVGQPVILTSSVGVVSSVSPNPPEVQALMDQCCCKSACPRGQEEYAALRRAALEGTNAKP